MPAMQAAHESNLETYLADHAAGAAAGIGVARHLTSHFRGTAAEPAWRELVAAIEADRDTLLALQEHLGFSRSRLKEVTGVVAASVSRVKLGVMTRRRDVSRLLALETLSLGIAGKQALWQALAVVFDRALPPGTDFEVLEARALEQRDLVNRLRLDQAAIALDRGQSTAREGQRRSTLPRLRPKRSRFDPDTSFHPRGASAPLGPGELSASSSTSDR